MCGESKAITALLKYFPVVIIVFSIRQASFYIITAINSPDFIQHKPNHHKERFNEEQKETFTVCIQKMSKLHVKTRIPLVAVGHYEIEKHNKVE